MLQGAQVAVFFVDKNKTRKRRVGKAYSCSILNLSVRHITSRL